MLIRCEIGAEMTEVQYFRRKVGAGSKWLEEEFDFSIKSLIKDGLVAARLVIDCEDRVRSQVILIGSSPKVPYKHPTFPENGVRKCRTNFLIQVD